MAAKRPRRRKPKNRRKLPPHEALVKGLNHPLRAKALSLLGERIASPKEIAEALDQQLANVSYHVGVLEELGLIELVEEERVRGAVAHFYRTVERDALVERIPLSLDDRGWKRVVEIQTSALGDILKEQAAAEARMKGSRGHVVNALLGLLLFEVGS